MRDIAHRALAAAVQRGVVYASVRVTDVAYRRMALRNTVPGEPAAEHQAGLLVQIQTETGRGYAATTHMDAAGIERAVADARARAREFPFAAPVPAGAGPRGTYATAVEIDPFVVDAEEYYAVMDRAARTALRHPAIRLVEPFITASRVTKVFVDTRGSELEQRLTTCGGGIRVFAERDGHVQRRSHGILQGTHGQAGFEFVSRDDQESRADRLAQEATMLLDAAPCPDTTTTVILGTEHLALLLHESCGHASEFDRASGDELTFAGGSFLTPERRGRFRYGSELVTIVADGSTPGAMGTYAYDDEGFPPRTVPIVTNGRFENFLTSYSTAASAGGGDGGGCARGEAWWGIPLVRMPNLSLQPGALPLERLLEETDDGIVMETPATWSIDDRRIQFHFSSELAYEVKRGKRGRPFRNASYMGVTPRFWGECDAIADEASWTMWGLAACGKGEPMQAIPVGHGASPARFRNVHVLGSR